MKKALALILAAVMMLCVSAAAFADRQISLDRARQIALGCVGAGPCDARFTKACQTWDDGREVYAFEFWVCSTAYEMDVDAMTGAITDFSADCRSECRDWDG